MKQLVTPKQLAQAIDVSESSVKRWCDRGVLQTVRTPGGHRRLELSAVLEFVRSTGREIIEPALLGLPSVTGHGRLTEQRALDQLRDALLAGDHEQCRRIVIDLYLAGRSASSICDTVMAGAMHRIGDCWEQGVAEVYQERRATLVCMRVLAELRSIVPCAATESFTAIGGAPECDHYVLPTTMAEIVLRQKGWRAQSLGAKLPFSTLVAAIRDLRPQIFWLSVSHIDDEDKFVAEYQSFYRQVRNDVAVVVGGRALTESLRRRMEYTAFGDSMQHLETFAETLMRTSSRGAPADAMVPNRFPGSRE